jgi:phosphate:Na+ symporter
MIANLTAAHRGELTTIANAYNIEDRLNSLRNNLRDAEIEAIDSGDKSYPASVYYIDIINTYERMGDFMINVSQDLERVYARKA